MNQEKITNESIELSVVMPCLNEAETLKDCIVNARAFFDEHQVSGEVVIADNGSTDGSQQIAKKEGARLVSVTDKGYGSALRGGIGAARGKYIVMGDADMSYDFRHLEKYLSHLRDGFDLVMGNRFEGGIQKGAMPFLHKYLGNPVLSFIGRLFFSSPIRDFHCGLRGFRKSAFEKMELKTTGMEFASEMVVKASLLQLKIAEVPTTLAPDGRTREPHLRTWHDGWRHLRFLLLYSPKWLFLYPGVLMCLAGLVSTALLIYGPVTISNINLDVHTLLYSLLLFMIGFQSVAFYSFSTVFSVANRLLPESKHYTFITGLINLERGILIGAAAILIGLGLSIAAVYQWHAGGFGDLLPSLTLRFVMPAVFCILTGSQIILFSFFHSILSLRTSN
jgi:glycosyltransferase involved in cell wall biosynthesis